MQQPRYTSRIARAGALISEAKTLLSNWDDNSNLDENLDRLVRENPFGNEARGRVTQFLPMLTWRYLGDDDLRAGLVCLAKAKAPASLLNPILYFYALQADAVLHDVVIGVLADIHARGLLDVPRDEITSKLELWSAKGLTRTAWRESTIRQMTGNVLATLRDFGILEGKAKKRIQPIYLPVPSFAFIAFDLQRKQASGDRLVRHPEWGVFFLTDSAVERFFVSADQEKLLNYNAAGSVIRIDFPAKTLDSYAEFIINRAI